MESVETLEGKEIGKYKLHQLVGDGGQAVVYKAWHNELHAWVAIKFLKADLAKREAVRERFKQEARLQFRLQHPHIVRVIEIIDEGAWLGMAMDWVEGQDLEKYLEKNTGPVPYAEIERLLIPILHAVDHAHKQKIVHRDLKPSNILLHGASGEEIPKVMDFGIAKSLAAEESQTKTGSLLGTPSYIAPEQAQSTKHVDHRADIYALGITLYQMISGRLPFVGDDILQLIMAHFTEKPPAFETFGLMVPASLRAVVLKSLEKTPDARYSSCKAFADQLQAALKEAIASGAASALPTAQSTYSLDAADIQKPPPSFAGLLPSGEIAPENNTVFRSPTLMSEEDSPFRPSTWKKHHLVAVGGGLLIILVLIAFAFRSPAPTPSALPQQLVSQRTGDAVVPSDPSRPSHPTTPDPSRPPSLNPSTPSDPPNTPRHREQRPEPPVHPRSTASSVQPKLTQPTESRTTTPLVPPVHPRTTNVQTDPSAQNSDDPRSAPPTNTTPQPRPRSQALTRSKTDPSASSGACFRCLNRFAADNFGPHADGLHPCTPNGMRSAARVCKTPCKRDTLMFCRTYARTRFSTPLGNKIPISSMTTCRFQLPHLLHSIAQYAGYKSPNPQSLAACRKALGR